MPKLWETFAVPYADTASEQHVAQAALYLDVPPTDDVSAALDLLVATAEAHGIDAGLHIVDSQTSAHRPGLVELVRRIEAKRVHTVICTQPAPAALVATGVEILHPAPLLKQEEVD